MVLGTFDILHDGHLHMFKEAKKYGDFLIVVVARDEIVCLVKGKKPINNEKKRKRAIEKLKIADKVILGCLGNDRYENIKIEEPDIVALGYDQEVFVDKLAENIPSNCRIVRLSPYRPEIFKSSKLRKNYE